MRALRRALRLLPVVMVAVPGCSTRIPVPPAPAEGDPQAAYRRFLAERVGLEGRIDFALLSQGSPDLDAFVAWVARPDAGPPRDPADERREQLAFALNAYVALSLYIVEERLGPWPDQPGFYRNHVFLVRGRWYSLADYEDEVIRPLGDARSLFATRCLRSSGPPLPRQPFAASTLDDQLDTIVRAFVDDRRNVQLHASGKRVRLSPVFARHADDLLAAAPSLVAYCNRFRSRPLPADCTVEWAEPQYGETF